MKKKANKKNPQQIKAEQAHQKNLYLRKLKATMGIMGSEAAYDLLDQRTIDIIYYMRLHPIKMKSLVYNGLTIPNKDLDQLNHSLNELLKKAFINLGIEKTPVSLYDFYTYIETLYLLWRNAVSMDIPNAQKFMELLPAFKNNYAETRIDAHYTVEQNVNTLAWMTSDLQKQILWMKREERKPNNPLDNSAAYNNYYIQIEKPETILIDLDGKRRTIFRLGLSFPYKGISWLTVTPEELGINGNQNQDPLKVYIQTHALERLKERLGNHFEMLDYFIVTSTVYFKDIYATDDGSFLFAYKHSGIKLGYFKADIIDDKLIIRTFLFVTNNGTPEGKKLSELLGIQKEDKKFLGIDKLNTYLHSDIGDNQLLREIFCQAGCEGLFDLKKELKNGQGELVHCSNYLSHYLGLEKDGEESGKLLGIEADFE